MTPCFREGNSKVVQKVVLEIIAMTCLAIPMIYIHIFLGEDFSPNKMGFYCDDESIKKPLKEQTVPIFTAFLIWFVLCTFCIVAVEVITMKTRTKNECSERQEWNDRNGCNVQWVYMEIYRSLGYCVLGAATTFLFTDLSKFTIGRLRPHFLSLCKPDYSNETCRDKHGYMRFVEEDEEDVCTGYNASDPAVVKSFREARFSFMSGHSSYSFFCATYLICYLQVRVDHIKKANTELMNSIRIFLKVVKPYIQFGAFILAFWIALTRVSDYWHHPRDVLTGSLVGIIFGGLAIFTSGIAWKDSTFVKTSTARSRAGSRADYNHQAHVNDAKAKNNQKKKTTMYDFIIADGSH